MRKLSVLALSALFSCSAFAVSMNFSGAFRSEASYYNKPGLGVPGTVASKSFLSARALLNPNLVIDDHFSLKSQWTLLTSPNMTPNATAPMGVGQGSWVFGDVNTAGLFLSRAWLDWTSDFGVFRVGRMPFSWGYGLIWDAGNGMWDDFQTTIDRLEYRLHLGHVVGALAYSKPLKGSVLGDASDSIFYTVYLQYDNPELDVEGGVLYENQWRSPNQGPVLMGTAPAGPGVPPHPYKLPGDPYPLSLKMPYALSNHIVDLYLKKTVGYFTFGGEVGWLTGKGTDYNGDDSAESLNAFGFSLNGTYQYHKVKAFLEFLYASGDSNLADNSLSGFVLLHRNRRAGLILGRELLGPYLGNNVGMGSCVVYGNAGSFSGCYYFRPGIRIDWSTSWASGIEFIIARKASVQAGEEGNLGIEVDLGTEYSVYQNFDLGVNFGYLFAGKGLQTGNPSGAFAVRTTAALKF